MRRPTGRPAGCKSPHTKLADKRIAELARQGLSVREIAEALGYTYQFVHQRCTVNHRRDLAGVTIVAHKPLKAPKAGTVSALVVAALLANDGRDQQQIANDLGCTKAHVSYVKRRYLDRAE